jgi:hypothetical protein
MPSDLIWKSGNAGDDDNLRVHKDYTDESYDRQFVRPNDGVSSQAIATDSGGPYVPFLALGTDTWEFTLQVRQNYVRGPFRIRWMLGVVTQDAGDAAFDLTVSLRGDGGQVDSTTFNAVMSIAGLAAGQYDVFTEPEEWPKGLSLGDDGSYLYIEVQKDNTAANKTELRLYGIEWEYIEDVTGEKVAYT